MFTVDQLLEIKKSYAHKIRGGGQEKSITISPSYLECHQYFTNSLYVSPANKSVFHYLDMSLPEQPWDCLNHTHLALTLFAPLDFDYLS